jgi:hypothetical protein
VTQRHIQAIALDYGGTISLDPVDHLIAQKPVDPSWSLKTAARTPDSQRPGARLWPALSPVR